MTLICTANRMGNNQLLTRQLQQADKFVCVYQALLTANKYCIFQDYSFSGQNLCTLSRAGQYINIISI